MGNNFQNPIKTNTTVLYELVIIITEQKQVYLCNSLLKNTAIHIETENRVKDEQQILGL